MRIVDLEHHFITPMYTEALRESKAFPRAEAGRGIGFFEDTWIPEPPAEPSRRLADLGEGRIAEMDAAGVDFAVLSLLAAGVEPLDPAVGVRGGPRRERQAGGIRRRLSRTAGRHRHPAR